MELQRTHVAVHPGTALAGRSRLLGALAEAFDVAFVPWTPGDRSPAVVAFEALPEAAGVPVLTFAADTSGPLAAIRVGADAAVDSRLRGLEIDDRLAKAPLQQNAQDQVLASAGDEPVWIRSAGQPAHQWVRTALEELAGEELLYRALSARPLGLIAMIAFLRDVTADGGWTPPPLRASIVFDDPNVRWRRYGYIDYRELVEHADAHNYHAIMAMIPLDAAWAHKPTVELFQARRDRLSLVFHGNNHVKRELMQPQTRTAAVSLTAQALRRVQRFEQRTGLGVDRVMMPPHGMAARTITQALSGFGFDSLCAIHPLPWTEAPPAERPLLGWWPGEFVEGCAVIPRIPLSSSATDIALRAFMDHPVVLYGHHDDLADGLGILARAADAVNRLGEARWLSSEAVATSNYATRRAGEVLVVRPYSRRLEVDLGPGITQIELTEPKAALGAGQLAGWSLGHAEHQAFDTAAPAAGALSAELKLHATEPVSDAVAMPAWRPWPRVRRAVTEARDRALPLRTRRS